MKDTAFMFTMSPLDINPVFPGLWKVIIIIIIIIIIIMMIIIIIIIIIIIVINIEKNGLWSCKEK